MNNIHSVIPEEDYFCANCDKCLTNKDHLVYSIPGLKNVESVGYTMIVTNFISFHFCNEQCALDVLLDLDFGEIMNELIDEPKYI
jgi:hypothetical protein